MQKSKKYSVSESAKYSIRVLSSFNENCYEVGVTELSKKLGSYPSKIHRVLQALYEEDVLEFNANTRKYRLGIKAFGIGMSYLSHHPLRKLVRPHAEALARKLEANVNFAVLHQNSAIVLDRVQNLESSALIQRISFNIPLYCTGLGKALLANLPKERQNEIIQSISFVKYTDNTITEMAALRAELQKTRERGYALDLAETLQKVNCVGAPIMNENSSVVASLSVNDSIERLTEDRIPDIVAIMHEATLFISRQIGHLT